MLPLRSKNDAYGNRNVFRRKILYFSLDVVFEDAEIIGLQASDHPVSCFTSSETTD